MHWISARGIKHMRVSVEDGADELLVESPGAAPSQARGPYCRVVVLAIALVATLSYLTLQYLSFTSANDFGAQVFKYSRNITKLRVMSSGIYTGPIATENGLPRVMSRMVQHAFPNLDIEFGGCQMVSPDLVISGDNKVSRCPDRATVRAPHYIGYTNEPYEKTHLIRKRRPLFRIAAGGADPDTIILPMLVTIIHDYSPPMRAHTNLNRPYAVAYMNSKCHPHREAMFRELQSLLPPDLVHGLGRCSHTIDRRPQPAPHGQLPWFNDNFFRFYSEYEFVFAMENASPPLPGYITEKIMNAFRAGAVPIYWGDENTVNMIFNPEAYINVHSFPSIAAAAERVKYLHEHPAELHAMMQAPIFKEGVLDLGTPTGLVPFMPEFERGVQRLRDTYATS